jgi:hypothetical protein
MIYILITILYIMAGILYIMLSADYLSHRITSVIHALAIILTWPVFFIQEYFDIFR